MSALGLRAPFRYPAFEWPRAPGRLVLGNTTLALLGGVYLTLIGSAAFWRETFASAQFTGWAGAWTAIALLVALVTVNILLTSLLLHGRAARVTLAMLMLVTAASSYFSWKYTVYIDDDMLRNVLHTDMAESRELLQPSLWTFVAVFGGIPSGLLLWVRPKTQSMRRACLHRIVQSAVALVVLLAALGSAFQPIAGLMHAHRDLRHLVAPANVLVSLVRVATHTSRIRGHGTVVGADAHPAARIAARKPRVLILVVGETVRAGNWGLNGYRRQTTPRLAAINPINYPTVTACGSSTEVSLPCMFAPVGRRRYERDRIEQSESVLHVLERAGIATVWRDNQSGCKGVCTGLAFESFRNAEAEGACDGEACLDSILLRGLTQLIHADEGDRVVVLHQLGSHGPGYHRRYPRSLERFQPTCSTDELADCTRESIVNAYDNSILMTDAFVASVIAEARRLQDRDTAVLYVSDHGESLGENGLYLHGVPYAVAPREQTRVPMILWLSTGFARSRGIDMACMRRRAAGPISHDHLFHTVLGLMDVQTRALEPVYNLVAVCSTPVETGP